MSNPPHEAEVEGAAITMALGHLTVAWSNMEEVVFMFLEDLLHGTAPSVWPIIRGELDAKFAMRILNVWAKPMEPILWPRTSPRVSM